MKEKVNTDGKGRLDMIEHSWSPRTWEAKERRSQVQGMEQNPLFKEAKGIYVGNVKPLLDVINGKFISSKNSHSQVSEYLHFCYAQNKKMFPD